jgi:NAD(P)-dependent dehydrogenase (short-subunit alcohol dehydrogenase family)
MLDFKDKVVLITGAAQGFGRVLAQAFAERGSKLALCDINDEGGAEALEQVKAQGADGFYLHADISREADLEAFVAANLARFGRLDVAVNDASKEISGATLDLPSEDFGTGGRRKKVKRERDKIRATRDLLPLMPVEGTNRK